MNSTSHYVVNFDPFAVRFPDGFFLEGIRWYGLSYMAGFLIALWLFNLYSKKGRSPLSKDDNASLITYLLFGIIIGGRLGYMLFYTFDAFWANPMIFFQVWKGGMASHGGFIGTIIALIVFAKTRKTSFCTVADLVVASASPGIFLGRIANFINGELWGKIGDIPWAMIFPHSAPSGTPLSEIAPRHPSQLYEAGAEGLFLFIYMQYRLWRCNLPKGQLSGEFLVIYGILRIVCEIFREPDVGISLICGLSRGSFYSLFAVAVGIGFIAWAKLKNNRN
ncbi:MAG: prolipoprotein diacylglyceryl transferase [Opitutales bacterium]|nr:prolipoprotein diacylglyceryl transferase [Opitutales bacterium]